MKTSKEILIEVLEKIRDNGPEDPLYGICTNVSIMLVDGFISRGYSSFCEELDSFDLTLDVVSNQWEKSSKDHKFPVSGFDAYKEHRKNGTLWVGEQYELRTELICKLIENLKG